MLWRFCAPQVGCPGTEVAKNGLVCKWVTPRKINMEPENTPLDKENHLPNHHFQVPC